MIYMHAYKYKVLFKCQYGFLEYDEKTAVILSLTTLLLIPRSKAISLMTLLSSSRALLGMLGYGDGLPAYFNIVAAGQDELKGIA